jgi:hypothetical protein
VFTSDLEVKEAVHTWLREQLNSFFSAGIQKQVERYNICIVLQVDYVEKLYVKLLTSTLIEAVTFCCLYFLILIRLFLHLQTFHSNLEYKLDGLIWDMCYPTDQSMCRLTT